MAALVEAFIDGVQSVEHFSDGSIRRLAIRNKITEYENVIRKDGESTEVIELFLQLAKDRAFEQIFRHIVEYRPTPTSEFFREVLDELSVRIRLNIRELKDGSFQVRVNVVASGGSRSEEVNSEFQSTEAAQQRIDSDEGNTLIRSVIKKYEN
jgi:hypothetical protein